MFGFETIRRLYGEERVLPIGRNFFRHFASFFEMR